MHEEINSQIPVGNRNQGWEEIQKEDNARAAKENADGAISVTYIYTLSDPLTGEVRYVGKTTNLKQRFENHLRERKNTHKINWIKSLAAQGLKPELLELEVVESGDESDWQSAEKFWISYLRFLGCRLCNLVDGGIGGQSPSIETRLKMSAARLGRKLEGDALENVRKALVARNKTPEQKSKARAASLGRKMTDSTKAALRLANVGRPFTLEHQKHLSESRTGRKNSLDHIAKTAAWHTGKKRSDTTREKQRAAWVLRKAKKLILIHT